MTSPRDDDRTYFPALDGLRAVAFGLVFLFHRGVPQFAGWVDGLATWLMPHRPGPGRPPTLGETIAANGWVGVEVFFVLSGYLITSLLVREEERSGRVDLRAFWMRRLLRIWPLYYLVIVLTFLIQPLASGEWSRPGVRDNLARQIVPFLAFGGNWSMAIFGPPPTDSISILWSVCVEEQFYLICPLLIAWIRPSRRVAIVVLTIALGIIARSVAAQALLSGRITPLGLQFATTTHLDTLAAGVLLGLVPLRRLPAGLIAAAWLGGIVLLATPGLAHGSTWRIVVDFAAIWAVSVVIVAGLAGGDSWIGRILSYRGLVGLGRISYGLYMFHELALALQRAIFDRIGWFPNREILGTIAGLMLTIGMAAVSYRFFEWPFLRLKSRWSRVASRPRF